MYLVGGKLHREELFRVTLKHDFDCTYSIEDTQIGFSNSNKKLPLHKKSQIDFGNHVVPIDAKIVITRLFKCILHVEKLC